MNRLFLLLTSTRNVCIIVNIKHGGVTTMKIAAALTAAFILLGIVAANADPTVCTTTRSGNVWSTYCY